MAIFCKKNFSLICTQDQENINIIKVIGNGAGNYIEIIGVYISPKADCKELIENLQAIIDSSVPTVIMGDINICLMKNKNNPVTGFLTSIGFKQLVKQATHIEVNFLYTFKNSFVWT